MVRINCDQIRTILCLPQNLVSSEWQRSGSAESPSITEVLRLSFVLVSSHYPSLQSSSHMPKLKFGECGNAGGETVRAEAFGNRRNRKSIELEPCSVK
jgi:hypothetical protein